MQNCFKNKSRKYFNLKIKDLNLVKYEDLFTFEENSPKRKEMYDILVKEIEPELTKVKITEKIKLGLLEGEEFKKLFCKYFYKNIKSNLPSFFNNIKFIYQYPQQKSKIALIESILTSNIAQIESSKSLTQEILELNTDNSLINITPIFIWVYYFSAQHFRKLRKGLRIHKQSYKINSVRGRILYGEISYFKT